MRNWKRNGTEQLINLVAQNECIFNVHSFSYLDKKTESFNEILNDMKKTYSTVTMEEIKRKWNNVNKLRKFEDKKIKLAQQSSCM